MPDSPAPSPVPPVPRPVRFLRWWLRPRRLVALALALVLGPLALVVGSVAWVHQAAGPHLYSAARVPPRPVAIVLGAQVYADGTPSPFLAARLELGRQLYAAGKVRAILVTGDNGRVNYNEVDPMRDWLIARGVPARKVVGDYAGFDTYSSCLRATKIFGVRRAIVVTQSFHLPRAVALCRRMGIDAVGVGDDTQRSSPVTWRKLALRDDVACVKAVYDMVVRPDPTFLGRREHGIDDALR